MIEDKLSELLQKISRLEHEVMDELHKKEHELYYQIQERKVKFSQQARQQHKQYLEHWRDYLGKSRWSVIVTAPVVYLCLPPALLMDGMVSFYQAVCFPIYNIPKVKRRDYIAFDRHHLSYLNGIEKLNCLYCSYFNGLVAYVREIAARTEQYWCPIKHAIRTKAHHSRYPYFEDYGAAENYRARLKEIRQQFEDLTDSDS